METYVHCERGQDRTGLIVGVYRVKVEHWTKADAYQEMLKHGFHPILRGLCWSWQEDGRCILLSVNCLSSIRLRPSGVRRSEGERSEPSAAEPRRGEAVPRAKNWSRAGHVGFLLGCSQTHPTPNLT